MKDLIKKLAELDAAANKPKKKMLTESKKPNEKGYFKDLVENMMQSQVKPIPVVGKQNDQTQTGVGFLNITDNSPAAQAMQKAVSDLVGQKKAQIVMPTDPKNAPSNAGAQGQNAVKQQQQVGMQPIQALREAPKTPPSLTTQLSNLNYEINVEYEMSDYDDIQLISVRKCVNGEPTGDDISSMLSSAELGELEDKVAQQIADYNADYGEYQRDAKLDREMDKDLTESFLAEASSKEEAIEKIRKLQNTSGRTPAEKQSVQNIVNNLMSRWNITSSDLAGNSQSSSGPKRYVIVKSPGNSPKTGYDVLYDYDFDPDSAITFMNQLTANYKVGTVMPKSNDWVMGVKHRDGYYIFLVNRSDLQNYPKTQVKTGPIHESLTKKKGLKKLD